MSTKSSLELALTVAKRERDRARQDLAQAQLVLDVAQQQLRQLDTYAQETQSRWITQSAGQAAPQVLRHYHQFMEKLQQALALQRQVLQDRQQAVYAKQAAFTRSEFTLASREMLIDQIHHLEQRRSAQREQKQLDELAAAQYRRNHSHVRGGELP